MIEQISTPSSSVANRLSESQVGNDQALSSDFDTFIRMLTVQVENQDPLNPIDSTDYATQLATFSSVEQQVLTNDLLKDLGVALGGTALQQAGSWIGLEGLVRAPAQFDRSSPVSVYPDVVQDADTSVLVVRNSAGDVVERAILEPDTDFVTWDGVDESGGKHPADNYRFEVESYRDGELLDTTVAKVFSRIEEVRSVNGEVLVRFADGTERPSSLITGLRSPS
ncbi:flagellar hook capping FlgD N-terminal domain-containing protein [Cognatishimia sp. F0-27]|uniref:flagellar hook capping FlgD N-terminal domain-containing protein n=1 Tax=Cognatishimia sp. F0-27 TaxID=2816855 RepID=UPI001D0C006E|nr:flagellar hook capping FlgD N-terminal domain-containing protein [Cognatishimia sp. F0-27]MCC1494291.1 hypothetical protein [Cognatishimia sp. F0-27]